MKFIRSIASILTLLIAGSVGAGQTGCPAHYPGGVPPEFVNVGVAQKTRELCNYSFATVHSGITRTPLWSAEYLTKASVRSAKSQYREDVFHSDGRLPASERSELRDYARSGMDRGHVAPSGDMPDRTSQEQSFALSNMVPQNPEMNRGLWAGIEMAVRDLAQDRGALFVITGPIFEGQHLQVLNNRVAIPTSLFKLVYDPSREEAAVYLAPNKAGGQYKVISVIDLEKKSGINFLPGADLSVRTRSMSLPAPRECKYQAGAGHSNANPRSYLDKRLLRALTSIGS